MLKKPNCHIILKHTLLLIFSLCIYLQKVSGQNCYNYIAPVSSKSSTTECIAKSESAIYYGGTFNEDLNLSGINLTYQGGTGSDVFLAKTDRYGQLQGAISWGGKKMDHLTSIATYNDIIYAAGYFTSDTLFVGNDTLFNHGQIAAFIVTYDTLGNYISSFSPDAYNLRILSIDVTSDGKLLLTGDYYQYFNIDGESFISLSGYNYFLMKYDYWSETLEWFNESNGKNTEGKGIATDSLDNIYVCGIYGQDAIIDGNLLSNSNGNHNTFIAKYNSNGVLSWINTVEGNGEVHGYGIDVSPTGQSFITGEFENSITFQSEPPLSSSGLYDVFVISYDSAGNIAWTKSYGGNDNDIGRTVRLDMNNNPVILSDAGLGFSIDAVPVNPNGNNEPLIAKANKTNGTLINHYRVKSKNTVGVVQSKSLAVLDTTIFVGGKNYSSVWCETNEYVTQNTNDCYFIAFSDSIIDTSTHIKQPSIINEFSIYPNPSTNYVTISFRQPEHHNIKLFNSLGKLLLEKNTTDQSMNIDLTKIKGNSIFLLVIDNNITTTNKIILTK